MTRMPRGITCLPMRAPTLPPATHTNCYILGHAEAIVVDPGSRFPGELDRLRRILWDQRGRGGGFQGILLTHHHPDHVGDAARLASELDTPLLVHPATLANLASLTSSEVEVVLLTEGRRLMVDGGRLKLVCLHTPGHTEGHLCLLDSRRRFLLGGDMVPGIGTTLIDPPEGDMAHYIASLRRIEALLSGAQMDVLLLPGHGPALPDGGAAIRSLLAHRLWRSDRILQVLDADRKGVDLWSIARQAYDDVPPWTMALAARSTLAHLIQLEREGRARRRRDLWTRP